MSWFGSYNGTWFGGWWLDGGEPPPPLIAQWRVRRMGLGIGLVYIPRPTSALA